MTPSRKNLLLRNHRRGQDPHRIVKVKGKAIPGHGGCEMSRLPHYLESWLTDDDEVVSLTRRLAVLYPQEDSWYSFLLEAESTPGPYCGWND
jgi:hypothetical protein